MKTALTQFIEWYAGMTAETNPIKPKPLRVMEKAIELLEEEKRQASRFTDWTNEQTLWVYTVIKKTWINSNDYSVQISTEQLFEEFLKIKGMDLK